MSPKEQWLLISLVVAICLAALSVYAHYRFTGREETVGDRVPAVQPPATETLETAIETVSPPGTSVDADLPAPEETHRIAVSVAGAVHMPGLYEFSDSARVQDLIEEAGGPLEEADLSDINRAARLIDGTTLTVPAKSSARMDGGTLVLRHRASDRLVNPPQYTISGWRPSMQAPTMAQEARSPRSGAVKAGEGLIDLSRATLAELESLPGIGPKLGAEIIRYRATAPFQSVEDVMNVPGIGPKRLEAMRGLVTVGGPGG